MLSKTERVPKRVVSKTRCPICGRPTINAVNISETDKYEDAVLWFFCTCGVVFQEHPPEKVPKDQQFIDNHFTLKEYDLIGRHAAYVYSPLIEELVYGRKMLDVGFGPTTNMEYFRKRGWITFGMDSNKDIATTERIYQADFEEDSRMPQSPYDLIWMSTVLEQFHNPKAALQKAYDLLQENGVLYIATPDTDFLYSKLQQEWTHWQAKTNYIMWNIKSLTAELEKIGFQVIMARRNYYQRFGYLNDIHLICQKIYF